VLKQGLAEGSLSGYQSLELGPLVEQEVVGRLVGCQGPFKGPGKQPEAVGVVNT
jgi:hypothetical protein